MTVLKVQTNEVLLIPDRIMHLHQPETQRLACNKVQW